MYWALQWIVYFVKFKETQIVLTRIIADLVCLKFWLKQILDGSRNMAGR